MAEVDFLNPICSLIGAGIGALAAIYSTKRTLEHAADLARQEVLGQERALILSLRDEMAILSERYKLVVGDLVDQLPEGKPFDRHYPVGQEYFTIYRSNGALIGKIGDGGLRKAIILTYIRAIGLVDSFSLNNRLLNEWIEAQRNHVNSGGKPITGAIEREAYGQLVYYAGALKRQQNELKDLVVDMMAKIQVFESAGK